MESLERALRLSSSRLSLTSAASRLVSICPAAASFGRFSPTAAAGLPEICGGLAAAETELPPLQGQVGGSCVEPRRKSEYVHPGREIPGFPDVPEIAYPSSDCRKSHLEVAKSPTPAPSYASASSAVANKGSTHVKAWRFGLQTCSTSPSTSPNMSTCRSLVTWNCIASPCARNSQRLFSSLSSPEIIASPPHQIIQPGQRLFSSHALGPSIIAPSPPEIIKPGQLPPLRQLSFFNPKDMDYEEWDDPVEYLQNIEAVGQNSLGKLMLLAPGRLSTRSLIKLVAGNKWRGYDIARSLHRENLLISKRYGTFALKECLYDPILDATSFKGYKAAKNFLESSLEADSRFTFGH